MTKRRKSRRLQGLSPARSIAGSQKSNVTNVASGISNPIVTTNPVVSPPVGATANVTKLQLKPLIIESLSFSGDEIKPTPVEFISNFKAIAEAHNADWY